MLKRHFVMVYVFIALSIIFMENMYGRVNATKEEILLFLNLHVPELLSKHHVSGTVIAWVQGENVVSKGYGTLGYDLEDPMDAEQTPVFVASLSKLFTATGIMQLYEQDKLSLDIDVNQYLKDFKIVYPYPEHITIHHLLTHTAGFDDRFLGMGAKTKEEVLPLGIYLAKRLPPIVFPPGTAISYSNHGFALLGHIIEEVSGKKFNDYMKEHLFEPLEMISSRFDGTCPETLKLPKPYLEYLGRVEVIKMDFAQTPPASSLCTTAEDFSHFLIAMTNGGKYKDRFILKPDTVQLMLTPRYKLHPLLPGYACCWEERFIHGKKMLQHSGLTWGFSSHVLIIPDENFGLFVSINKGDHSFINELIFKIVERFTSPISNLKNARKNPSFVDPSFYSKIAGFYRHNRYCRNDYFKLATFLPGMVPEIFVRGDASGQILTMKYLSFPSSEWKVEEIGDMLWGRKNRDGKIASSPRVTFIKGYQKKPYQLVIGNDVYEPIYFWETKLFQYVIFFSCIAVYLMNFLIFLYRLCGGGVLSLFQNQMAKFNMNYYQILSLFFLLYILCFGGYLFMVAKPQALGYGTPIGLFIFLILPYPLTLLTIITTVRFVFSLEKWEIKMFFNLMSLFSCYGLLFLLYYWNFLGLHISAWDTLSW